MKPLQEITSLVVDAGTFIPLADMMGRAVKKSYYYSPFEQEYLGLHRCCIGDGHQHFERLDEWQDPDTLKEIDLLIFPDIGYGGTQKLMRSMGKAVWGSFGASDLELLRTKFIKTVKSIGLDVANSVTIRGVTALAEHLKVVENKWIKVNRYREDAETWFHKDWKHSERELEREAYVWGPLKEYIVFVVQDAIDPDDDTPVLEIGYDGWAVTIDGELHFPESSFQGYEKKNQLYLGSLLDYGDMPDCVLDVNEAISPVLAEYGYRNFWATEIRQKGDKFYFIDPTARMAGQTMEHLLNTCTNLPDVIWHGANGKILKPKFLATHAAEATLHYKPANGECEWKTFIVPEESEDHIKLYRCCHADGAYHFPPHKSDELGVVCGDGDSIEDSVEDLKDYFELIKDEPVSIELSGFADLVEQIKDAEKEGVEFTDQPIPKPEAVV